MPLPLPRSAFGARLLTSTAQPAASELPGLPRHLMWPRGLFRAAQWAPGQSVRVVSCNSRVLARRVMLA